MSNWISVKDRLPDKDGSYLIAIKDNLSYYSVIRDFRVKDNKFGINSWFVETSDRKITHWMPLPEPPEREVAANVL